MRNDGRATHYGVPLKANERFLHRIILLDVFQDVVYRDIPSDVVLELPQTSIQVLPSQMTIIFTQKRWSNF